MELDKNKPLYEVKEVLPIFNVDEHTFYDWIKRGDIFPKNMIIKMGRFYRIRRNILVAYLEGTI